MPPKKTPTSSLSGSWVFNLTPLHLTVITVTVIMLLVAIVYYRSRAMIQRILSGNILPKAPSTRLSPVAKLPQELIEMIIGFLAYDTSSLRACSMTCYSWYIAAVPHLHHTLILEDTLGGKFRWPDPILHMDRLGLLPLVKSFRLCFKNYHPLSPKLFCRSVLYNFAKLTNVRELWLEQLDIPSFMSGIQRYFDHFLPTVQSLTLTSPKGSRRQIVFFVGLFRHLEDLSLRKITPQKEPENDLTLVPPFSPPLGGRLVAWYLERPGLIEDMIDLFGGIRFGQMNLFDVDGTWLLLNACAKTLWRLQLRPTDPRGK